MSVKGFFKTVGQVALPMLSAALPGPLGPMAAALIGKALNTDVSKQTPDELDNSVSVAFADPTQRSALLKAEEDFQAQALQLGFKNAADLATIAADDRASARTMETTTRSQLPAVLAVLVTMGFFGLLVLMIFRAIPAGAETVLNVMTGSLGTAWIMVITFYFGSSAGSDRKTEIMAAQTTGAKP